MLSQEDVQKIIAEERRGVQKRLGVGIPLIIVAAIVGLLRLERWGSESIESLVGITIACLLVIAAVAWTNTRWLGRITHELTSGNIMQKKGAITYSSGAYMKLENKRFRLARTVAQQVGKLAEGEVIEINYLNETHLVVKLKKADS
ncbi:MAG: hypothetical protein HY562_12920 [Ignavibacteriales bacterium]|nr:hypothetical protein [Ignavibacteriales bacterium]